MAKIALFVRPRRGSGGAAAQVSSVTDEVVARLRAGGAEVDVLVPEAEPWDLLALRPAHDLYVLKSKTPTALAVAGALAAAGARAVNGVEPSRLAKNKLLHTALLARAGVPLPPSWAVGSAGALRALARRFCDGGAGAAAALLVKPPGGSMAKGICRLAAEAEVDGEAAAPTLAALGDDAAPRPLLAQGEVPSADGLDLKIYVVGDWVAAIRRPFPARTEAEKRGTPAEPPPPIREAALACGRALGLELYGVDVLVDGDRFWVVDVNAFPSYKGIDGAVERVADYLLASATSRPLRSDS